jgi:hypothetical protein
MSSQSTLIHKQPVLAEVSIKFKNPSTNTNKCCYRNKYGESICNKNAIDNRCCKKHIDELKKFTLVYKRIFLITEQIRPFVHDTKMKSHLFNFAIKHKECFLKFNLENLSKAIIQKFNELLLVVEGDEIFHQNVDFTYFKKMKIDIDNLDVDKQIKMNRNTLTSNLIKIQKLSEIHVQNKYAYPVICKGIDDKIISYII